MDMLPFDDTLPALASRLFDPIEDLFLNAKNQRLCHAMADEVRIRNGVERALIEMESGCGFLQGLHYHPALTAPKRSTYFAISEKFPAFSSCRYGLNLRDYLASTMKAVIEQGPVSAPQLTPQALATHPAKNANKVAA